MHVAPLPLTIAQHHMMASCLRMTPFIWIGTYEGKLACVWGLIPPTMLSNRAYLWLHTTELAREHRFLLVRHSQVILERLLKEWDEIVGQTDVNAADSI